jgi:uncharacterized membrane protein YwzB
MKKLSVVLVIFGIVSHLLSAFVTWSHTQAPAYDFFPDDNTSTTAYLLTDLAFKFSLALGFYVYQFAAKKSLLKFLLLTTMAFVGNDIIDELFCNPYKWQLNETILLIVILISGGYYLCKINTTS